MRVFFSCLEIITLLHNIVLFTDNDNRNNINGTEEKSTLYVSNNSKYPV